MHFFDLQICKFNIYGGEKSLDVLVPSGKKVVKFIARHKCFIKGLYSLESDKPQDRESYEQIIGQAMLN